MSIEGNRLRILLAAAQLGDTFTPQDLIVQAWRMYPKQFGMQAYKYPDSNRVVPRLYGDIGIIKLGWVKWVDGVVSTGRLEITELGQMRIAEERVRQVVAKQLHLQGDTLNTASLRNDLGAEQVDLMEIAHALENVFGIELSDKTMSDVDSMRDLVDAVRGLLSRM